MRKFIDTEQISMKNVLEDESSYEIPKFQREYSWLDEEVETFWNDLFSHYQSEDRSPYFFGTIMLVANPEIEEKYRVVDGQQRLSTSLIFLCVVRDLLLEFNRNDDVERIREFIEIEDSDSDYPYRLAMSKNNYEFFRDHILKPDNPHSKIKRISNKIPKRNKNLATAYSLILDKLDAQLKEIPDNSEKIRFLINIANHFLKYFVVVRNIIDTPARAYRIFDTLNNRGIDLNESDLVKNYLLEAIDHSKGDVAKWHDRWLDILQKLDISDVKEDDFLRHYLMANYGPTNLYEVFESISYEIKNGPQAEKFIESLIEAADVYKKLKKPDETDWFNDQKIVDDLKAFESLSAKVVYPVLLKGFYVFQTKKTFSELIETLLLFFFRSRTICKTSATALENLMNKLCSELRDNTAISIKDVKTLLKKSNEYKTDQEFEFNFSIFDASPKNSLYILVNLNAELHGGKKTMTLSAAKDNISIEHIMPKEIKDTIWEKYLIDTGHKNPAEREDYHKNYLWKLGNLTILNRSKNFKAQNKSFQEKLEAAYKSDDAKITNQLVNWKEWNHDSILSRQKIMGQIAKQIWKIDV